jgi:hypothetical protein
MPNVNDTYTRRMDPTRMQFPLRWNAQQNPHGQTSRRSRSSGAGEAPVSEGLALPPLNALILQAIRMPNGREESPVSLDRPFLRLQEGRHGGLSPGRCC